MTAGIRVEKSGGPEILAGITGALAGIAETGSLVIPGGDGQPLTALLMPEIHLAILRASGYFAFSRKSDSID